jgi:two-component sensor histidine kinase
LRRDLVLDEGRIVMSVHEIDDHPPRINWRLVALLFAASFVVRFGYFYLDDLTRGDTTTLVRRLLEEGTGHATEALLFPIVVLVERAFPVDLGRWRRTWFVHLGTYVALSIVHTTLMAASRWTLFPAFGQGPYDYGRMSVRYFMEATQDFVGYVTFIGILTLVRVQQRLRQRALRAAELERDAATARLDALSARLQPHFLFNALNTISSTVYEDPVAADEMIGRLGDLLRSALHAGERHEVALDEELATLRAYLAFVDARFGDRLTVRLEIDSNSHRIAVPALLLQPLVENAVHHGAARDAAYSEISITAGLRGRALVIAVENDTAAPIGTPRDGTGLGTTRARLRLLYGEEARLDISEAGGRCRVTVTLPARQVAASPTPATEPSLARAHR